MKKIFSVALILIIAFVFSVGLIANAEEPAFTGTSSANSENSSSINSTNVSDSGNAYFYENYTYEQYMAMVESRNEELIKEALEKEGKEYRPDIATEVPESKAEPAADIGAFWYGVRERVLKMKGLPLDTRRITLEEVKDIIAASADINEIISRIDAIQIAPDFHGGSGITRSEYWLDDKGTVKVMVYYVRPNPCIALEDLSDPNNRKFIALYGRGPFAYTEDKN